MVGKAFVPDGSVHHQNLAHLNVFIQHAAPAAEHHLADAHGVEQIQIPGAGGAPHPSQGDQCVVVGELVDGDRVFAGDGPLKNDFSLCHQLVHHLGEKGDDQLVCIKGFFRKILRIQRGDWVVVKL